MGQFGFHFDMSRCIGCKACQVACKDRHGLAAGDFFRRADIFASDADCDYYCYSGACSQCREPECARGCPTGAMFQREDGTVGNDRHKCIGCGTCVWSCPFGAPVISARSGQARKCDSCSHERQAGNQPVCAAACVSNCLTFGDIDELRERLGGTTEHALPFLPDAGTTCPALLIMRS